MSVLELQQAPSTLSLYSKAVINGFKAPGKALPSTVVRLAKVNIDRQHLIDYDRLCGFPVRDVVPPTYLQVLSLPLQMRVMTDDSFPFALLGLVHIINDITQYRPVRCDEALSLTCRADNLRQHEKGMAFDLVTDVHVGDELVFTGISTYLRRQGGDKAAGKPAATPSKASKPSSANAYWDIPSDIGRRYGALSGDRNPIHLYAATAKLLGFPQAIAHGMWTKAACLAALDSVLPSAYQLTVQFKLPILLPARVAFSSQYDGGELHFSVHDARKGKPHLSGVVKPL